MCYPGTERCQKANPFILGGKPFYSPVYDPAACPLTLPVQPFLLFFDHSFPDLQVDSGFNSEVTSSFSFSSLSSWFTPGINSWFLPVMGV